MTQHDYKAAMEWIKVRRSKFHPADISKVDSIRHALLIADRLMQEPTYGMVGSFIMSMPDGVATSDPIIRNGFKAMRDQMLKEIEG